MAQGSTHLLSHPCLVCRPEAPMSRPLHGKWLTHCCGVHCLRRPQRLPAAAPLLACPHRRPQLGVGHGQGGGAWATALHHAAAGGRHRRLCRGQRPRCAPLHAPQIFPNPQHRQGPGRAGGAAVASSQGAPAPHRLTRFARSFRPHRHLDSPRAARCSRHHLAASSAAEPEPGRMTDRRTRCDVLMRMRWGH